MAATSSTTYATDPTLFLYTSLTAGSSHIITATSRLETILKANKIAFRAIDVATDEKARMIWGRRSKGRKLPGLVRYGAIVGDLEQIEEWNEYGELKAQIAATLSPSDAPATPDPKPVAVAPVAALPKPASSAPHIRIGNTPSRTTSSSELQGDEMTSALRQASEEAAAKAKENMRVRLGLKPQSSVPKSDAPKPEDQKLTGVPEKEATGEKKSEEKEAEKIEEDVKGKKPESARQEGEGKSSDTKAEEKKAENQPAGKDDEENPRKGDGEPSKLAEGAKATEQAKKADE